MAKEVKAYKNAPNARVEELSKKLFNWVQACTLSHPNDAGSAKARARS